MFLLDSQVRNKVFLDEGHVSRTIYDRTLSFNDYSVHVVKSGIDHSSKIGWQRNPELYFRQLWREGTNDDGADASSEKAFTLVIKSTNPKGYPPYCLDEERRALMSSAGYSNVANKGPRLRLEVLAVITIERQSQLRFHQVIPTNSSTFRRKDQSFVVQGMQREIEGHNFRTKVTMKIGLSKDMGKMGQSSTLGIATGRPSKKVRACDIPAMLHASLLPAPLPILTSRTSPPSRLASVVAAKRGFEQRVIRAP